VNETQYGGGNAVKDTEIKVDAETGEVISTVNTLQSSDYNRIRAMAKNRKTGVPIDFRKVNAITDVNDAVTKILNSSEEVLFDKTSKRYVHYQPQGDKDTSAERTDLIKMVIAGQRFYAYITDLSDQSSPNFDTSQDIGTLNPRYQFTSYERTIGLTFIVPSFNKKHYNEQWSRLRQLYGSSRGGGSVSLTIGRLYKGLSCIITDLTYNWDSEYPWDIDSDRSKPIYTEVSITFKVLSGTNSTSFS
jgi:hypothetical protein